MYREYASCILGSESCCSSHGIAFVSSNDPLVGFQTTKRIFESVNK